MLNVLHVLIHSSFTTMLWNDYHHPILQMMELRLGEDNSSKVPKLLALEAESEIGLFKAIVKCYANLFAW